MLFLSEKTLADNMSRQHYVSRTGSLSGNRAVISSVPPMACTCLLYTSPGWQKDFDPLRDVYNWREGWTRPDDPERFRVRTPEHADIHAARLKRWGQAVTPDERTNAREQLTAFLVQRIEEGAVTNRVELIEKIQGLGLKVPRQGKHYLTIEDDDGQRVRLKGGIYCEACLLYTSRCV